MANMEKVVIVIPYSPTVLLSGNLFKNSDCNSTINVSNKLIQLQSTQPVK